MKLKFGVLVLFISLISCTKKVNKDIDSKDNFIVTIEGRFQKNDRLQVFYLTPDQDWSDQNSIVFPVYGSTEMQKIQIDLPKKIRPINIRVDISTNENQSYLTLKNISVQYKTHSINGDNDQYKNFFYANEFISWDSEYFGYKLVKKSSFYDPYFMGNDLLIARLQQIQYKL